MRPTEHCTDGPEREAAGIPVYNLRQIGHQSSVIVLAVVRRGVTPLPTVILGVTVPEWKMSVAPPPVLPVLKCVTVPLPPVPAGKSMLATGLTLLAVTVHPPVVLATLTRA